MLRKESRDGYWYSRDGGEMYDGGPCVDREDAIAEGLANTDPGDTFTTAFCQIHHLKLAQFFDADRFLEDVEENQCDDYTNEDGDPVFEITKEQEADLQVMVRAAIDAWQEKHGLDFSSWYFLNCLDEQTHTHPGEVEEHPFPSVGPVSEESSDAE